MRYEHQCPDCLEVYELKCKLAEYGTLGVTCDRCKVDCPRIISAPSIHIASQHQASPSTKKETASVPINIFDEKPEGGYTVTRIGSKGDIDND
jgi:hypothetical protein